MEQTEPMTRVSGREFNQRASAIKRMVVDGAGPVMITDHGSPVAVLLSWQDYGRTRPMGTPLTELLADPASADIELPLERDSAPHGPLPL